MRIKAPGFYELSEVDYFADPCPKPSLTQSLAKVLLRRSPQHMWYQHPRLNPSYMEEPSETFDLGSAAHSMLFGRGQEIELCDYPDWRTKVAREHRDSIRARGAIALLRPQHERVMDMVHAWKDATGDETGLGNKHNGRIEITAVAEMKGVWLRSKIDWIHNSNFVVLDYKTTGVQIERSNLHTYAFNFGWHLQAAMHEKILDYLSPMTTGKRQHLFILQEAYRPYVVHKCQLGEAALELGRAQINDAIATFKKCLERDHWPGPSEELMIITPPAWGLRQYEEAKLAAEV